MFCKECGSRMSSNADACPKCGCTTKGKVSDLTLGIGYFMSFVIPFIGFIMALYVMAKGKAGHGIVMIIISILAFFFWIGFQSQSAGMY